MRRNPALSKILDGYRGVAAIAATVIVSLFAASILVLLTLPGPHAAMLPVATLLAGGLLLTILVVGDRVMRVRITLAAKATHAVMASIHRDALTGVATRSYFLEALRSEIYHGSARAVGYLQLDMDNLKVLNDSAGHAAGDAALLHLAATIREMMPTALVGRLGGDEFGIAVFGHDSRAGLQRVGEELLRRLARPVGIAGRPVLLWRRSMPPMWTS